MCRPIAIVLFLFCISCNSRKEKSDTQAFYSWSAFYQPTDSSAKLPSSTFNHLYLHYYDVTWSDEYHIPLPKPSFRQQFVDSTFYGGNAFTPVIHIENTVLEKLPMDSMVPLAAKMNSKLELLSSQIHQQSAVTPDDEIQFDCNWTPDTKDKYFILLLQFKQLQPKKELSATVNLYAFKERATMGVPPVNRVMLQCYDIGRSNDTSSNNANLDSTILAGYFKGGVYPLPLDLAFPVGGWMVHYREGKKLGYPYLFEFFKEYKSLFEAKDQEQFTLLKDTSYLGTDYKVNDILRREAVQPAVLASAIKYITGKIKYRRIAFWYWNPPVTYQYRDIIRQTFAAH
ncbi:MAG: hypothetical protein JO154_01260 [Chitinophaga sp.]|uniref:hypothetical protein n=1 Tax=Chitinophaga sp. TaxID=1869181 RepID=UPI0025BD31C2|nr:hypothetical protein [Chitinophaga sp.]MBV8251205.1 hypothetical protein [Chitinophaga sp.]